MKNLLSVVLIMLYMQGMAQNVSYFISPLGDDSNNGLTSSTPWKTITKVNAFNFQPGDKILFKGLSEFTGSIQLESTDSGNAANPIVVSSYGGGKAIIKSAGNNAVNAYNVGGIEVRNLVLQGSGATNNNASGVSFYMDQTMVNLDHIVIDSVEASGYGNYGIAIGSWGTTKGYSTVRIVHSSLHDNGRGGITSFAEGSRYTHSNIYVGYCKAFRNHGRADIDYTNTGSGIVLSGVNGATVEYCEAYENGSYNANLSGGPVGIWFYDVINGVIQFCESHHNKAGQNLDGGGFDLDGGCQNSIIQYCYSHENEGAGFALYEFGSSNKFINNTIRYNISQNDGKKNNDAGLSFWASDEGHKIIDCSVYNNTFYISNAALTNGTPSCIKISNGNMSSVKIRNNIFYSTAGIDFIKCNSGCDTSQILFQNNNFYSESGTSTFIWNGAVYNSLAQWKNGATGQETNGTASLGSTTNPMLVAPGSGGSINPAEGGDFSLLHGYTLQVGSSMINTGLNLKVLFNVNPGTTDFYKNSLLSELQFNVGAFESPSAIITFSGKVFLQGAYNTNTGIMNNTLNTSGILRDNATKQPYSNSMFNYSGTEEVDENFFAAHPDIIDWVLIKLRDAATPWVILSTKAAFVKNDGTLVSIDGSGTQIGFPGVAASNYFVSIHHRNHLAIRTTTAVNFGNGTANYDFTATPGKAYQNQTYTSTVQMGSVWTMRGGNANSNSNIKYNGPSNDQDRIQNTKLGGSYSIVLTKQYSAEDINLDGKICVNGPGNDQNFLLNTTLNGMPGTVYLEQF